MRILCGDPDGSTPLRSLGYAPDGKVLAAGDEQGVILYSLPEGEQVGRLAIDPAASIEVLAFSPDGKHLAAGLPGGVVVWKDLSNAEERVECDDEHPGGVRGLAWSPDGGLLVSGGWDRTLRFWTPELTQVAEVVQTPAPVTCLAILPDGEHVIGGMSYGGLVFCKRVEKNRWDVATAVNTAEIYSLAVTRDGALLASGHRDGSIRLWDARRREELATLPDHDWVVYGLAFTPDGGRLVSGGADGTVRLWDVPGRRLVATWRWHERWINSVAVAPDGMTAASGGDDGKAVVWDLADA